MIPHLKKLSVTQLTGVDGNHTPDMNRPLVFWCLYLPTLLYIQSYYYSTYIDAQNYSLVLVGWIVKLGYLQKSDNFSCKLILDSALTPCTHLYMKRGVKGGTEFIISYLNG